MRTRFRGLMVCLALLTFGLEAPRAARGASVEEMIKNAASGGGKLVAEAIFRAAAGFVFKNHCGAAAHDVEQLICGALGSYTGADEKAWKEGINRRLESIQTDLKRLDEGQRRLHQGVQDLIAQNDVLLGKLGELPNETVVQQSVRTIQSLWEFQFQALFRDEASFSRDQLVGFAKKVVEADYLIAKIGEISQTLATNGTQSRDPLLMSWARTLNTQMAAKPGKADLLTAYSFLEQNFADLLFEQRRGYLMYIWAAQILDAECDIQKAQGKECSRSHMPGTAFQGSFDEQIAKQFAAFNDSIEWLVLANSDPHGAQAGFLHRDAEGVFRRLDLFTSANLQSFGLRGRIISMGDPFDGEIQVDGKAIRRLREAQIPTAERSLDWWRATTAGKPDSYDEVHFAGRWRVLHYQNADAVESKGGRITSPRLAFSKPFDVERVDLFTGKATEAPISDSVRRFGSFTAIERVGGGFALASGGWDTQLPKPEVKFNGTWVKLAKERRRANSVAGAQAGLIFAAVETHGRVVHTGKLINLGKPLADRTIYRETRKASVSTKKRIRFVPGGLLRLNVEPISGFTHLQKPLTFGKSANGVWGDIPQGSWGYTPDYAPSGVAVGLSSNYQMGGIDPKPAILSGRAALVFGTSPSKNGFVHAETLTASGSDPVHSDWIERSALVRLEAGESYPLLLETEISVAQQPRGLNATEFDLIANGRFSNVYLTEN